MPHIQPEDEQTLSQWAIQKMIFLLPQNSRLEQNTGEIRSLLTGFPNGRFTSVKAWARPHALTALNNCPLYGIFRPREPGPWLLSSHLHRAVRGRIRSVITKGANQDQQEPQGADSLRTFRLTSLMRGGCPITASEQRPNDPLVSVRADSCQNWTADLQFLLALEYKVTPANRGLHLLESHAGQSSVLAQDCWVHGVIP